MERSSRIVLGNRSVRFVTLNSLDIKMKNLGILVGTFLLCSAASAQIGPIPSGWVLMGQNLKEQHKGFSYYRISPILLPKDTVVDLIMIDAKGESYITQGNAISKKGRPIQISYRQDGWGRSLYIAAPTPEGERRMLFTTSSKEGFVRFLPDVSRLIDSWVIAPAAETDSSSAHWGTQKGSEWLMNGSNAVDPKDTKGTAQASPPPLVTSGGGTSTYSGGNSGSGMGPSVTNFSGVRTDAGAIGGGMIPGMGDIPLPELPKQAPPNPRDFGAEKLVYDPITRKFQVIGRTPDPTFMNLDGEYSYTSDRMGGPVQAHLGTLNLILKIKGDKFSIRQSLSGFVMVEGTFMFLDNQIRFVGDTPDKKVDYGFIIVSQFEGRIEKIAIGGAIMTRLR